MIWITPLLVLVYTLSALFLLSISILQSNTMETANSGLPMTESCNVTKVHVAAFNITQEERVCSLTPSGKEQHCIVVSITGRIENFCKIPIAVQLRISALDHKGVAFQRKEVWLNDQLPVAPGVSNFDLDGVMEYEPETHAWKIEVIKIVQ